MKKLIDVYIISYKREIDFFSNIKSMNIIGSANDFEKAMEFLRAKKDIIVIIDKDMESPKSFKEFINFCVNKKIKTMAICSDVKKGFELLNSGVTEFVVESSEKKGHGNRDFEIILDAKLKNMEMKIKRGYERKYKLQYEKPFKKIVAIGSSTGGTEAVEKILVDMPSNCPPILIVQHMPPVFTRLYAERLNSVCDITVWEAKDGDKLRAGLALIAPGDKHMRLVKKQNQLYVQVETGDKVDGHCPSVTEMFNSIADVYAKNTIGIILTGMGADGATGLLKLRNNGALTIGQNKESCIVYGMPKAAYDLGAVHVEKHIDDIGDFILKNS